MKTIKALEVVTISFKITSLFLCRTTYCWRASRRSSHHSQTTPITSAESCTAPSIAMFLQCRYEFNCKPPPMSALLSLRFLVFICKLLKKQCCRSGMFMPDPEICPSWIEKQQLKRVVKNKFCPAFYCSHNYHTIENYIIFQLLNKKNLVYLQRIIELFTQKIVIKLSGIR